MGLLLLMVFNAAISRIYELNINVFLTEMGFRYPSSVQMLANRWRWCCYWRCQRWRHFPVGPDDDGAARLVLLYTLLAVSQSYNSLGIIILRPRAQIYSHKRVNGDGRCGGTVTPLKERPQNAWCSQQHWHVTRDAPIKWPVARYFVIPPRWPCWNLSREERAEPGFRFGASPHYLPASFLPAPSSAVATGIAKLF
ncbi:MAG: hypothetical protein U0894_10720 [Pirellulales bacterium]